MGMFMPFEPPGAVVGSFHVWAARLVGRKRTEIPAMAQISGRVRSLKRYTKTAAITSSISAPRLVPAASAPIALEQAGSCSFGSSRIASALCNGGAVGGKRSGGSSIHTSRSRAKNSRTGVGSPKLRSRDGQITTTCHFRIGPHLRFEDQDRQIRLIGWGEEQSIQAVFPFFKHRRAEHIALHPRQPFSHQGLEAVGVLLEQPVEEFVAGDHGEDFSNLTGPTKPRSAR